MEKNIEKLIDNLNDKYEELFILSSRKSHVKVKFDKPIVLESDRKYKMGLSYFSVYNSIRNITEENNSVSISKLGNGIYENITLPPGSYEISDIEDALAQIGGVDENNKKNIRLLPKVNLNKVELVLQNKRAVMFVKKSFNNILGFEEREYKETTLAEHRANIQNDINLINIQCDKIIGGYLNDTQKNIIYSIPSFTVGVGFRIVEKPVNITYLKLNTNVINEINLYIKDQNDNLIDFGGEEITIQLHLKQI